MKKESQTPADRVVSAIIDALKKGVSPWHKPWHSIDLPQNVNGRRYRGINRWYLSLFPFENPVFLTFHQALELGGNVKKGEHGLPVLLWKKVPNRTIATDEDAREARQAFHLLLRGYTVFNVEQCEGLPDKVVATPTFEHDSIPEAEAIWEGWNDRPALTNTKRGGAKYSTAKDMIFLPPKDSFETAESYYETLFHESGHATGAEHRLNRPNMHSAFGTAEYAREELIAELCASLLCAKCGITRHLENAAAYCASWAAILEKTPARAIVSAASAAQKAADYISGNTYTEQ